MFEFQLRELVHQLKVIILEPHVLPYVHQLYLPFNECPLSPLSQLPLCLLRRSLDLMKEGEVQPLIKKVA
jgi:hypothetical protein